MKTRFASALRLGALGVLALGLSGFGPRGCGPLSQADPCEGLDEQACRADPTCQARFDNLLCACAPCAPNTECPPCVCGDFVECGPASPPPICARLGESACLERADCRAVYDGGVAPTANVPAPVTSQFAWCEPICEGANACRTHCPYGYQRDARGCELCACKPGCASDADCASDEFCSKPELICPPGMECPLRRGVCELRPVEGCLTDSECASDEFCSKPELTCPPGVACPTPRGICELRPGEGCRTDSDCAAGEFCSKPDLICPPGVACPTPRGVCERSTDGCRVDADCLPGQLCDFWASCMAIGCPTPPSDGVCRNMDCGADGKCPPGSSCIGVPSGGRAFCQTDCGLLDEKACMARADCRAIWGSSACDASGNCTPDRAFRCEQAACPPVACDVYCEFGHQLGADGCPTCACNPPPPGGCSVDADCGRGEVCLIPPIDCPPGAACAQPRGVCAAKGRCLSDADCAAGESCIFLMHDCLPGTECWAGSLGTCNGAPPPGCASDAECGRDEVCLAPPNDCPPGADCGPQPLGVCAPRGSCLNNADCGANEYCDWTKPADACPPGASCPATQGICRPMPGICASDIDCSVGQVCWIQCGTPPVSGICRDATCRSDRDCAGGQVCRPDLRDPCNAPDGNCLQAGVQVCQQPCAQLGETTCRARADCRALYTTDAAANVTRFVRCE